MTATPNPCAAANCSARHGSCCFWLGSRSFGRSSFLARMLSLRSTSQLPRRALQSLSLGSLGVS